MLSRGWGGPPWGFEQTPQHNLVSGLEKGLLNSKVHLLCDSDFMLHEFNLVCSSHVTCSFKSQTPWPVTLLFCNKDNQDVVQQQALILCVWFLNCGRFIQFYAAESLIW